MDVIVKPTNSDFARFVSSLLTSAVQENASAALHRASIALHTGILLEFLKRSGAKISGLSLSEGTLAWVFPAALEPLIACSNVELKGAKQALQTEVIVRRSNLPYIPVTHACAALFLPHPFSAITCVSTV